MNTRNIRRAEAIERMADHLLVEGIAGATLRPLAAAAGTSDRMLLYYFGSKDELLAAVLDEIASRLLVLLDDAIPAGLLLPFGELLKQVWAVLSSDDLECYMHVWLEVIAGAARGLQPHCAVAGTIADGYLEWVTSRLASGPSDAVPQSAPLFLAVVEGMYLLQTLGRPEIAREAMLDLLGSQRTPL